MDSYIENLREWTQGARASAEELRIRSEEIWGEEVMTMEDIDSVVYDASKLVQECIERKRSIRSYISRIKTPSESTREAVETIEANLTTTVVTLLNISTRTLP